MLFRKSVFASSIVAAAITGNSAVFADPTSQFSWMLPKTVFDVTATYTLKGCSVTSDGKSSLSMGVAAALTPNAVPDNFAGRLHYSTSDLVQNFKDNSISITTYSGTDILNSLGSTPNDETATVVGNILGGVTKIASIVLGAAAAKKDNALPCPFLVQTLVNEANDLPKQQANLLSLQQQLVAATDDTTQKNVSSEITAVQNLIAQYTKDITFQVTVTVDPGFSPAHVTDTTSFNNPYNRGGTPKPIPSNGLVSQITPTLPSSWLADPINNPSPLSSGTLDVFVYLDFANSNVKVDADPSGTFTPRGIQQYFIYREPTYIPVLVWWGDKNSNGNPLPPKQLMAPQLLPFGQFGQDRQLPFQAGTFESLKWSVTFSQFGEMTSATFTSQAIVTNATNLFQTEASIAGSIAAAVQTANSAETRATALQGQADLIYQQQRLAQCQASPPACTSK